MKNLVNLGCAALVLTLLLVSCKPKVDLVKEQEAIKAVINAETQAWIDRDSMKIKKYYVQDDFQTRLNIQDSVYNISTGWKARANGLDSLTRALDWSGIEKFKVEKDFLVIKVMDNTAWAIFKETQDMIYNGSPAKSRSIISVMLEKNKRQDWKISCFVKNSI
jgi:hypothetical protein